MIDGGTSATAVGEPQTSDPEAAGPAGVRRQTDGLGRDDKDTRRLLWLITLVAFGLRLWYIDGQPLWLDEAFSVWLARHPLDRLLPVLLRIDKHPPLYYVLLHYWMAVLDGGDASARSLSTLAGTLCVPAAFLLGREVAGRTTGLLVALLVATAPGHIAYSREVRMYTLATLLATVSLACFVRLLHRPPETVARSQRSRIAVVAAYVLSTAAALWTHNAMMFLPAAQTVAVGLLWALRGRYRDAEWQPPPLREWLIVQACVLALWAPWVPAMVQQATALHQSFWLKFPTLAAIEQAFLDVGGLDGETRNLRRLVYYVPYLWCVWCWRRSPGRLIPLLCVIYVPVLAEYLVSYLRPIFLPRTVLWITIPFLVLVAAGLLSAPRPRWAGRWPRSAVSAGTVGMVLAVNAASLAYLNWGLPQEGWAWTARWISSEAHADDLVFVDGGWSRLPLDRYFLRGSPVVREVGLPSDPSDTSEWDARVRAGDTARIASLLRSAHRAWLVRRANSDIVDPDSLVSSYLKRAFSARCTVQLPGIDVDQYWEAPAPGPTTAVPQCAVDSRWVVVRRTRKNGSP